MMIISGAYGRDYKSAKAVREDFDAGKDFIIRSMGQWEGKSANRADLKSAGETSVQVRYSKDTKVMVIKL